MNKTYGTNFTPEKMEVLNKKHFKFPNESAKIS